MRYDIVAIVASARGLTPLRRLLQRLPRNLPVPVVCLSQAEPSLAARLSDESGLEVRWASSTEPLHAGLVYLSPPGGTTLLLDGGVTVAPYGPESTSLHPQDRFLESVAARYGSRALCIVLGSFEEDGVQGARAVKERGGTVLVLDRATAGYWGMAEPILRAGHCDRVLAAEEVAEALRAWFTQRDIIECAELQVELQQLLDSALRMTGTRMGDMQLFDAREQALRVVVHRGFEKRVLEEMAFIRASEEFPCARALRYRQRVVIEDLESDPRFVPYLPISTAGGFRASQSTPIYSMDTEIGGVFSTHYPYPHQVSAEEAQVLDGIAREARPFVTRFQRAGQA